MSQKKILEKKNKSILFLGTSQIQVESIRSAKKFGLKVIGVDYNKFASGRKYCDHFIESNCNNINFIFKKILKLKNVELIDIWANNDILLISRNKLLKRFRIKPENNDLTIKTLLNKKKFKKLFPKETVGGLRKKFPLIAKPTKGSGSQGIIFLKNKNDYLSLKNKKNFIYEKYFKNLKEYGINFYKINQKLFILNSVYRYFDHKFTFAPLGTVEINNNEISRFLKILKNKIMKLNISGKLKIDLGICGNKFLIIEASNRFHGEIDTSVLFSFRNNSLSDFYFSMLTNKKIINTKKLDNFLYGYIVCYKKKQVSEIKKIFKENRVNFVKFLKRDNYTDRKKHTKYLSTQDIFGYAFYKTKKKIQDAKFTKISNHINKFKNV